MNIFMGEHIRLTGLKPDDMESFTRWYQDSEFMRQLDSTVAFPHPANKWQKWFETLPDLKNEYHFAIRPLDSETMLGWLVVEGIQWNHRTAWIGIGIGDPDNRGKGYGAEAMRLAFKFVFHELNMHRLNLTVFSYNTAAIRLYERLGFVQEGVQREFLQRDGQRHDMIFYGLLASEWQQT